MLTYFSNCTILIRNEILTPFLSWVTPKRHKHAYRYKKLGGAYALPAQHDAPPFPVIAITSAIILQLYSSIVSY